MISTTGWWTNTLSTSFWLFQTQMMAHNTPLRSQLEGPSSPLVIARNPVKSEISWGRKKFVPKQLDPWHSCPNQLFSILGISSTCPITYLLNCSTYLNRVLNHWKGRKEERIKERKRKGKRTKLKKIFLFIKKTISQSSNNYYGS